MGNRLWTKENHGTLELASGQDAITGYLRTSAMIGTHERAKHLRRLVAVTITNHDPVLDVTQECAATLGIKDDDFLT